MVGAEYNKLRSVDVVCDRENNLENKLAETLKYRSGLTLLVPDQKCARKRFGHGSTSGLKAEFELLPRDTH